MLRFVYFAFCTGCMVGFYYFMRWIVYSAPGNFGEGFVAGMFFIVILFFLLEKAKVIAIVELDKGTWIPHEKDD